MGTVPGPEPLWNHYLDDVPWGRGGPRDLVRLWRASRGRDVLILNGPVGRRLLYRDLVFAIVVKHLSRQRPRIFIHNASWEPTSPALAGRSAIAARILPALARGVIHLLGARLVRYAVLSLEEVKTLPRAWGVDQNRVVFQLFPNTLHEYQDVLTSDGGCLFSGGNSIREDDLLERALRGKSVSTRIAKTWSPSSAVSSIQAGPTTHEKLMHLLAGARAVVVPLRTTVRSGGQQTYLNAMALGKPVIVTEAPGVSDYVQNRRTGVVVPADEHALRTAIKHVIDPANADEYAQMGQRGRADVLTRGTEETFRHGPLRHAGLVFTRET